MEWQPIETAPKDDVVLLAVWDEWGPYYCLETGWWEELNGGFWSTPSMGKATHWMPLPEPPPDPVA